MDWLGFTVSFKGVFLEGLEVAFIVLTFGTSLGVVVLGGTAFNGIQAAALAALAALILVAIVGAAVHRPLAQVPENQLKFAVGIMLSSFGTFWAGEGIGVEWPGSDTAILALLVLFSVVSWVAMTLMRRASEPKRMPEGTRLRCVAHFDNSEANLWNPDPKREVTFGLQTSQEMMVGFFETALVEQDLLLGGPQVKPLYGDLSVPYDCSHLFIAIDVSHFCDPAWFSSQSAAAAARIRSGQRAATARHSGAQGDHARHRSRRHGQIAGGRRLARVACRVLPFPVWLHR